LFGVPKARRLLHATSLDGNSQPPIGSLVASGSAADY